MASTFFVEVVTPERVVYREEVNMIIARAVDGDIGILANHSPLITALKIGLLRLKKGDRFSHIAISGGGFMEVTSEKVTILADAAEKPGEIDIERAKAAKERAERRLAAQREDIDYYRAEMALRRATTRLEAVEKEKAGV
ncbi:MAG: F0F1 ATP synthase subunit epsilon [Candidatus Syntrophonatronum acetioxidans]|uniref:ATP synthase epsilon chain n=1 Tax=Candidatus Syntrophonatronum acetioxidans TaxID=1795816 RepID=A0A424YFW4_9FIRM|nr:MAG: F0F1 ATP synthase subunit epsilon [Candidatus Syntrophonatronum acetioxidans]